MLQASTGSALELLGFWSEPPWSRQLNGTICAPVQLLEFLRLQALFAEVAAVLAAAGVNWLLSHGSLLGAWLHHGPIPWDEESDIVLFPEDFQRLWQLLGSPARSAGQVVRTPGGSMRLHEGPRLGSLQCDLHEHVDEQGGWLATAVTFRLAADPRDSPVHLDAFLARTNGSHAWTDSAVLPLEVLLPTRRLRFFDWLVPAPHDPKAALELWYGPRFAKRRKCALRPDADSAGQQAVVGRIAEVPASAIARSYPLVQNEWTGENGEALRCTVHLNGTVLWVLNVDTHAGRVVEAEGLPRRPRLVKLGEGCLASRAGTADGGSHQGGSGAGYEPMPGIAFPAEVPNLWD